MRADSGVGGEGAFGPSLRAHLDRRIRRVAVRSRAVRLALSGGWSYRCEKMGRKVVVWLPRVPRRCVLRMGQTVAAAGRLVRAVASEQECRCVPVMTLVVVGATGPVVVLVILVVPLAWTCSEEMAVETLAATYRRVRPKWMLAVVMICETGSER